MADREELIVRKQMLQGEIAQLRRKLTQLQASEEEGGQTRQITRLQDQLDRLMGQEYSLRLQIDRSRR